MRKRLLVRGRQITLAAAVTGGGVAIASGGRRWRRTGDGSAGRRRPPPLPSKPPGGQADAVERDGENGATWEVEVTKPDGRTVDVRPTRTTGSSSSRATARTPTAASPSLVRRLLAHRFPARRKGHLGKPADTRRRSAPPRHPMRLGMTGRVHSRACCARGTRCLDAAVGDAARPGLVLANRARGVRRLPPAAVAGVDRHVRPATVPLHEHQVAGPGLRCADPPRLRTDAPEVRGSLPAGLAVDVADETRSSRRSRAAPGAVAVGLALLLRRDRSTRGRPGREPAAERDAALDSTREVDDGGTPSAFHVRGPTIPVRGSPERCWKRFTAAFVAAG